jgi:hypothetical protein
LTLKEYIWKVNEEEGGTTHNERTKQKTTIVSQTT